MERVIWKHKIANFLSSLFKNIKGGYFGREKFIFLLMSHKKTNLKQLKNKIQTYWTDNVPGLDVGLRHATFFEGKFYLKVDKHRFKYNPYIPKLIKAVYKPSGRVLEVGCGLGTDLREFSRLGMRAYGLDLSYSNSLMTKIGLNSLGLKGEVVTADAENLPFKDSSFDVVYSFGVLHHTPDTQKAIDEIYRVLVSGGTALIMLYHKGYAYYWIIIVHWILRMKFLKYSKQELINTKYDHTPLSKMYSKKEAKELFHKFKETKITCLTFGGIQENKKLRWIWILFNKIPFLIRNFGSFLIIKAKK